MRTVYISWSSKIGPIEGRKICSKIYLKKVIKLGVYGVRGWWKHSGWPYLRQLVHILHPCVNILMYLQRFTWLFDKDIPQIISGFSPFCFTSPEIIEVKFCCRQTNNLTPCAGVCGFFSQVKFASSLLTWLAWGFIWFKDFLHFFKAFSFFVKLRFLWSELKTKL